MRRRALSHRYGRSATGNYRVDAFLDGDHFSVIVKKGQVPSRAVAHSLSRRMGSPVTLWPEGRLQHGATGESFRAQWYCPKTETNQEAHVDIWDAYQRGGS
jgi:hypothetical protein